MIGTEKNVKGKFPTSSCSASAVKLSKLESSSAGQELCPSKGAAIFTRSVRKFDSSVSTELYFEKVASDIDDCLRHSVSSFHIRSSWMI